MSGGGGSTKTVTQNYSPEEAQRRAQLMDIAMNAYNNGQLAPVYSGAAPVAASTPTLQGQASLLNAAGAAQADIGQLRDAQTFGLTGAMDVNNNPYFQDALAAALRPQEQALTRGLQQVGSAAQAQGAYGGARHGLAEAQSFDASAQSMSDTAAKMGSEAYGQGLDVFSKTLALAPQTMSTYSLPSQWMSAVGAQQENLGQAQQDYLANKSAFNANADITAMQNLSNFIYGAGGSQATTTAQGPGRNPLLGAIGGGMSGAMLGSQIGMVGGPAGAAAGAILGALFM